MPALKEIRKGHFVACHRVAEINTLTAEETAAAEQPAVETAAEAAK
jgi:hypothetical protein